MLMTRDPRFVLLSVMVVTIVTSCSTFTSPGPASAPTASTPGSGVVIPSEVELVLSIQGDPNTLNGPADLDVDEKGNVYIVDSLNNRLQIYDSSGAFLAMWGSSGEADGQFKFASPEGGDGLGGIALDREGNVFVADAFNRRLQRLDPSGQFVTTWSALNSEGTEFFGRPISVAVDQQGNIYTVDDRRNQIIKFTNQGEVLARWGERGSGDGQLNSPGLVFVDSSNSIFVADFDNHRIQKFDAQGLFVTKWGSFGDGDGEFNQPTDVAIDAEGNIYVTDYGNNRVQVFDQDGNFLYKWGSLGSGDYQFNHPVAITIDRSGNIYIADYSNDRVQKFRQR